MDVPSAIAVVAVEIAAAEARELLGAAIVEQPLAGPRYLQVEGMFAVHIVSNVSDLDHHGVADKVRVRSPPVAIRVDLVSELENIAFTWQAAEDRITQGTRNHVHDNGTSQNRNRSITISLSKQVKTPNTK